MATANDPKLQSIPEQTVANLGGEQSYENELPATDVHHPGLAPSAHSHTGGTGDSSDWADHRKNQVKHSASQEVAAALSANSLGTPSATNADSRPEDLSSELVWNQNGAREELGFLVWNDGAAEIVNHIEQNGRTIRPPELKQLGKHLNLRLPHGVSLCPAPEHLFSEICDLTRKHVEMPEASLHIVAAFCMSTWFIDKLPVAPYLWISGPPGSGKTTLLRLLHCVCRQGVLIGGIAPLAYSLPDLLQPTLIFDELKFSGSSQSQAFQRWLRAGNSRGVPVTMGKTLVDPFCAKVLCSRQPTTDTALGSRTLHISMMPWSKKLPPFDDAAVERTVNYFQPRLLMLRLSEKVRPYGSALSSLLFSPRMQDLAQALLVPFGTQEVVGEILRMWSALDDLRNQDLAKAFAVPFGTRPAVLTMLNILSGLEAQENTGILERANEPEGMVAWALFELLHRNRGTAMVGEITLLVNRDRKRCGEEADLKPRAVGAILRSLGLPTNTRASCGRGLRFTESVRSRIHQLARTYRMLPSPSDELAACPLCLETWGDKIKP